MQIRGITEITAHLIMTDNPDYPYYTRYSPDNWKVTMGESEETVFDCQELEEAFQKYRSKHPGPSAF